MLIFHEKDSFPIYFNYNKRLKSEITYKFNGFFYTSFPHFLLKAPNTISSQLLRRKR